MNYFFEIFESANVNVWWFENVGRKFSKRKVFTHFDRIRKKKKKKEVKCDSEIYKL